MRSRILLAIALALLSCSGAQVDPMMAAEVACHTEIQSVIRAGSCDEYEVLEDCPWFALAMQQCRSWLDDAELQAVEK